MKKGEIVFCNLKLKRKNGLFITLKRCIFSKPYEGKREKLNWGSANDRRLISQTNLKEDLKIIEIEILKSLGFRHKGESFSKVNKSENNQRLPSGTYV